MKMPEMEERTTNVKKKEFLRLTPGNHVIRLLPGEQGFYITYTHWIRGANIECLGNECPICLNNKRLIAQNPDNFRNSKGYSRKRQVFYVNVLDKTMAKTCPSCNSKNKAVAGSYPSTCQNCNSVLVNAEPKPLNNVCILNRGKELYSNIKSINNSILDEETGEKIGVENFDLMLMVPPETRRPAAQGLPHKTEPVEVEEEELFNLKEAPLRMTAEEIKSFLNGVSLSDIYSARNAGEADTEAEEEFSEELSMDEDLDLDSVEPVEYDNKEISDEDFEKFLEEDETDVADAVKDLFDM